MPRPRKSADELRSETARVRLTLSEREQLREQSARAGLDEAEFMRRRILGLPVTPTRSRTDPALVAAVNRVGVNVNQLAAATHMGRDFTRFWREIGDELRGVLAKALEGIEA